MERLYWALMGTCWLCRTNISRRRLSRTPPRTTTTPSRRSSSLKGGVLSQDTSVTPYIHATYFHLFPPQSATSSTAICHNLPSLPNSAKSAEFRPNQDNARYSTVNPATKLTIYTSSSLFFIFFPYATSWPFYAVHVRSLIIYTLLHIIVTRTYSVTRRLRKP